MSENKLGLEIAFTLIRHLISGYLKILKIAATPETW